jgi:hypothetical protein
LALGLSADAHTAVEQSPGAGAVELLPPVVMAAVRLTAEVELR